MPHPLRELGCGQPRCPKPAQLGIIDLAGGASLGWHGMYQGFFLASSAFSSSLKSMVAAVAEYSARLLAVIRIELTI